MMDGFFQDAADRLKTRCPALLQVESGMTRDAVEAMTLSHEVSALVHPLSDQAETIRQSAMLVSQGQTWTFGVMMALTFPGGFAQWETARREILAALRGWNWRDLMATPVAYAGGATVHYSLGKDGGRWLHLLRFTFTIRETYEHQS